MAYMPNNLQVIIPSVGGSDGTGVFAYSSDDDPGTIDGAGYFTNGKDAGMRVGDFLLYGKTSVARVMTTHIVASIDANGAATVSTAAIGGGGGSSTLDGLTDTDINAVGTAELMRWNGTHWANATLVEAGVEVAGAAAAAQAAAEAASEPADSTILKEANLTGTGSATTPAKSDHTHTAAAATSQATGYNKAFGTSAGTVSEGNHTHPIATETLVNTDTVAAIAGLSTIDSITAAVNVTLANGALIGDEKIFVMTDASFGATVSLTTHQTFDPEIFTFNAVGEYLILKWMGTDVGGWITIDATATV